MLGGDLQQLRDKPAEFQFAHRPIKVLVHEFGHIGLQSLPRRLLIGGREFEQRVGHADFVAAHDAPNQVGKRFTTALVKKTHHAEIQKTNAFAGQDVDVARMRVGMEEPVRENLFHDQVGDAPRDLDPVQPAWLKVRKLRCLDSVDVFHRQDTGGRQVAVNFGQIDRRL